MEYKLIMRNKIYSFIVISMYAHLIGARITEPFCSIQLTSYFYIVRERRCNFLIWNVVSCKETVIYVPVLDLRSYLDWGKKLIVSKRWSFIYDSYYVSQKELPTACAPFIIIFLRLLIHRRLYPNAYLTIKFITIVYDNIVGNLIERGMNGFVLLCWICWKKIRGRFNLQLRITFIRQGTFYQSQKLDSIFIFLVDRLKVPELNSP